MRSAPLQSRVRAGEGRAILGGLVLPEALRLYLQAPDTPDRPSRADWAVAADLHRRAVPLDTLAHAIRLASIRRRLGNLGTPQPITSLAYFRSVLPALAYLRRDTS